MNRQKLLCVLLMCFGFSLVYAAAQTQPAAGPPAAAPATNLPPPKNAAVPLPDPQTPEEFFARARQLSDLEASGIPFHLKATYVASGDTEFTGNGTYEEWWQSKDLWRTEATLGDYKYVVIRNGATTNAYATNPYLPLRLRQAMDAVLVRLEADAGTTHEWKIQHTKLEGSDFAVLFKPDSCDGTKVACFRSFFTTDGMFRGRSLNGRIQVLYNSLQPFQNLQIARNITKEMDGIPILRLSITSIEPLGTSATPMSQAAPVDLAELPVVPFLARTDSNLSDPKIKAEIRAERVTGPRLVKQVDPKFPESERVKHRGAVVAVACTIDATGAVREPYAQVSAGAAFDEAAIEAIRQYEFKPAVKHGEPMLIDVIIPVHFYYP
jgi:TonB family protein